MKVYTFTYNKPEYLELQYRAFQKCFKEDFEFIVFNNSTFGRERRNYGEINETCRKLGLQVIDILMDKELADFCQGMEPVHRVFSDAGDYGSPNVAHAYAFMYAWKHTISKERGPILILDFDMFPIKGQKPTDLLIDNDAVFIPQGKQGLPVDYMWPGFVLLNMANIPEPETMNWWCGFIGEAATDVGGHTSLYLAAHPELKVKKIAFQMVLDNPELDFHPTDYQLLRDEDGDATWVHWFRGSGWNHPDYEYVKKKDIWLRRLLNA